MMIMWLFVGGAAISFFMLASPQQITRDLPFWLPAIAAFGLSIGRNPSILFLILFLLPTVSLGVAALFSRISPTPFLIFAASDVVLAIGLSIYQSKSALWGLPPIGGWGDATGFAAAAGLLRMGALTDVSSRSEGALLSLGWWQGGMLLHWAGSPAVVFAVVGGLLLWLVGAGLARSGLVGLTLGGGALAISAGLGVGPIGLFAIGIAATALAMGERVASVWAIGLLPVSLVGAGVSLPTGAYMALPAMLFPAAWAVMATRMGSLRAPASQVKLLAGVAGGVGVAYLLAVGFALAPDVGSSSAVFTPGIENTIWLVYGASVAAAIAGSFTNPPIGPLDVDPETPPKPSQFEHLIPQIVIPLAWLIVGVSVALTVRLVLAGLKTGFL
jgi:hypothetical protein